MGDGDEEGRKGDGMDGWGLGGGEAKAGRPWERGVACMTTPAARVQPNGI